MGYALYTKDPVPSQRRVIATYDTAVEAADDLGVTPQRIIRDAAYTKRYWQGDVSKRPIVILTTGDNRKGNGNSQQEEAFELLDKGATLAELQCDLGVCATTARRYINLYSIAHAKDDPGPEPPMDHCPKGYSADWLEQFKYEWTAATQKLLSTKRRRHAGR